jgi:hypothetical protein
MATESRKFRAEKLLLLAKPKSYRPKKNTNCRIYVRTHHRHNSRLRSVVHFHKRVLQKTGKNNGIIKRVRDCLGKQKNHCKTEVIHLTYSCFPPPFSSQFSNLNSSFLTPFNATR